MTIVADHSIDINNVENILWKYAEKEPEGMLYAILDCAVNESIYHKLASSNCEYLCLYKENMPMVLAKASPYLVELKKQSAFTHWLVRGRLEEQLGSIFFIKKRSV